MLTERGNIESIHFVDGCIMQRGREKKEIKSNQKSQEYKGSCSGGDQDMDVTTIVYNSYYQVLKLFSEFTHPFSVGDFVRYIVSQEKNLKIVTLVSSFNN